MEGIEPATKTAASRRVLKIVSKCTSEAEFLAVFYRFCDHESLFVVTKTPKPVDSTSRFAITLSDGKPMLVGAGRVTESSKDGKNELGRPGMRIRFTELDQESRETLAKLNAARATAVSAASARGPAAKSGRATIMAPAVPAPSPAGKVSAAGTPPPSALPGPPIKIPNIPTLKGPSARSETERKPMHGGKERLASPRVVVPPSASLDKSAGKDDLDAKEAKADKPLPPPPRGKNGNGLPLTAATGDKSRPTLSLTPTPAAATPAPALVPDHEPEQTTAVRDTSQADEDAPTNVSDRAPSDTTAVDNPTGEVRAEGSDFILPANPFGEITDESLEAFVECTLYEETGTISIGPDGEPQEDENLPPWWPKGGDGTHTPLPPAAPGMFGPGMDNTGEVPLPPPPAGAPMHAHAYAQADPTAAGMMTPVFAPQAKSVWLPIAVTAAATAVLTLVMGYFIWGGGDDARTKPGEVTPAPSLVAEAPPEPAVPPTAPAPVPEKAVDEPTDEKVLTNGATPTDEAEPADDTEAANADPGDDDGDDGDDDDDDDSEASNAAVVPSTTVGADECRVSVTTYPDGARIYANGRALRGRTPLEASVPCTTTSIEVKRSRYDQARVSISPRAGTITDVGVRLHRPKVQLRLVSYPAGATVTVGGRNVGTAPLTTTVDGFLYTKVTFSKSGYQSNTQRIYPKQKLTLVKGKLAASGRRR